MDRSITTWHGLRFCGRSISSRLNFSSALFSLTFTNGKLHLFNCDRCVFLLATSRARRAAEQSESESLYSESIDSLKRKVRILRYALISAQAVLLLVAIIVVTIVMVNGEDSKSNEPYIAFQYYYTVSLFSLFLFTYLGMFIALVSRLKSGYYECYEREKPKGRL